MANAHPSAAALESCLLEFQASPTRYALSRREPALLFSALDDVIQLAIGRDGEATSASAAARFFIRRAFFPAATDHYRLLGLERTATADDIKKRYRLLMRLLHPDFATEGADWRAEAAVRVNVAYETLSSATRRRDYDGQLSAPPAATAVRPPPVHRRPPRREAPNFRGPGAKAAIVATFLIAMMLMAFLFLTSQGPSTELVQRAPERERPVVRTALQAVVQAAHDISAAVTSTAPASAVAAAPQPAPEPLRAPAVTALPASSAAPSAVEAPAIAAAALAPPPPAVAEPAVAVPPVPRPSLPAAPAPIAAPAIASAPPAIAAAPAAPAPAPPPARIVPAGPSIAEAQPLLLQLLQRMESGSGEELVALLDRGSRASPDAQALAREFSRIAQGSRPRIAGVQFRGEPREGRLLVRGAVKLRMDDQPPTLVDFTLQAEFAQRDGAVVLTRLAPGNH